MHTIQDVPVRQWRWPDEPPQLRSTQERAAAHAGFRSFRLPAGFSDNETLRRAVIESPDDDNPRAKYATWMRQQEHPLATAIGNFITAQLRVASTYHYNPLADVADLRNWSVDTSFVSTIEFRAGGALRPWYLDSLNPLRCDGLVGWPQIYRGFLERVYLRANRFLAVADELFALAPIRQLVLIDVPQVIHALATSPHLGRIRSLSLPRHSPSDAISDEVLAHLLESPHLGGLRHLRLVQQVELTQVSYERVVTAPTLPMLSLFEVYKHPSNWIQPVRESYRPHGLLDRMIAYDWSQHVAQGREWIAALEERHGYLPCVHAEDWYGRLPVDIEAVVAHPIATAERALGRRGEPVQSAQACAERGRR